MSQTHTPAPTAEQLALMAAGDQVSTLIAKLAVRADLAANDTAAEQIRQAIDALHEASGHITNAVYALKPRRHITDTQLAQLRRMLRRNATR